MRYFAYATISSSDHSRHSSQRLLMSQSKPLQAMQTVCRSADFLLILLGQEEHFRRPSTGVSTEESDDEGGTGGTGGVNPGSSNENSLITENTKKAMMRGNREPKTKFAAPPPSQKIRKSHYVCMYVYIYIYKAKAQKSHERDRGPGPGPGGPQLGPVGPRLKG